MRDSAVGPNSQDALAAAPGVPTDSPARLVPSTSAISRDAPEAGGAGRGPATVRGRPIVVLGRRGAQPGSRALRAPLASADVRHAPRADGAWSAASVRRNARRH